MNKRYFQLKYNPTKQEYVIDAIPSKSKIDRTKIQNTALKYDPYTWVCTNKDSLIEEVEKVKLEKLMELENQMKSIKDRPVIIN